MKRLLPLFLFAALPALADQHPSMLSLGIEGGMAWGSVKDYRAGRLYGGRIKYDIDDRWAVAARFQGRTFSWSQDQTQRVDIRPVTGVGYFNLLPPSDAGLAPYAFAELGISQNRRMVLAVSHASQKPAAGIGLGVEWREGPFLALSLEAGHRFFPGASPTGGQVSENSAAVTLSFYLPDDWIPIHPDAPLKIPDADDVTAKPSAPPLPDVEKRQAQLELDKVQQDIRDRKIPPIHFETGQSVLLEASHETLDIVGTILRRYPAFSVLITGHTDNVGAPEDNQILSLARAEVVRAYLIQNFGLPAEKLAAQGAGQDKPIADNSQEDGRLLNRRVEFTIQP